MEEPKVIIERRVLHDSGDSLGLQRFALVYLGMQEHRVYAPSRVSGDPVQWRSQLAVHIPSGYGELSMPEPNRSHIIEATFRELERSKTEAAKAEKRDNHFVKIPAFGGPQENNSLAEKLGESSGEVL